MTKGIVLSVEDDESIQLVLRQYLEGDGYSFVSAGSGQELKARLQTVEPSVILLDLKLPDADGTSLIQSIRNESRAPIIVLSGTSDTTEKIVCLELGADDYLTKPVEMRELSARIKAVLRRSQSTGSDPGGANSVSATPADRPPLAFGRFQLDCNQFELFDANGAAIGITAGEFRLIEALAKAPNRVLSRDFLYTAIRAEDYDSYDRAIDIQIGRIRKKLGDDGKHLIKTVRGIGYMFTPPQS
jgi:two-component system, OmpR family, response regulator